jgi:hypothetical protein
MREELNLKVEVLIQLYAVKISMVSRYAHRRRLGVVFFRFFLRRGFFQHTVSFLASFLQDLGVYQDNS